MKLTSTFISNNSRVSPKIDFQAGGPILGATKGWVSYVVGGVNIVGEVSSVCVKGGAGDYDNSGSKAKELPGD